MIYRTRTSQSDNGRIQKLKNDNRRKRYRLASFGPLPRSQSKLEGSQRNLQMGLLQ